MSRFDEFKLTIELVPETSWYDNLRKLMPKTAWDKLRKTVYAECSHKCGVCGAANGRLHCHEMWEYDEERHKQRLVGFTALCGLCHLVKHIGLAAALAEEGALDYKKIVKHFMKVNGCNRRTFEEYREWAFAQWDERSQYKWQVELGKYASLFPSTFPKKKIALTEDSSRRKTGKGYL